MQRSTAASETLLAPPPGARRSLGWFATGVALASVVSLLIGTAPAAAQQTAPGDKDAGAKTGKTDDSNGKESSSRSDTGAAKSAATDDEPDAAVASSRPEYMTLEKPMLSEAELKALTQKLRRDYMKPLREGNLNAGTQELIRDWATWRVYGLTVNDPDRPLPRKREDLLRELGEFAKRQNKDSAIREFREFACKEVADRAAKLLDNNVYVRVNAVLILNDLNLVESSRSDPLPLAYAPAARVLLTVIADKEQHPGVQIVAARGLWRIALVGEPAPALKIEMIKTMVQKFNDKETDPRLQQRLAHALGAIDTSNLAGATTVVDALSKALVDRERDWSVRAEAARALGRTPLSAEVRGDLIAYEIARVCHEMSAAYNADPKKVPWYNSFWNLCLAFKPMNSNEQQLYTHTNARRKVGLLAQIADPKGVKDAYDAICPVAGHVVGEFLGTGKSVGKPIAKETIEGLHTWLNSNEPSTNQIAPDLRPLRQMKTASVPAMD